MWFTNPTGNHEVAGLIPGLAQWVTDPALLWLWCKPAATALIRPLAREPPYAADAALEIRQKKKIIDFSSQPFSMINHTLLFLLVTPQAHLSWSNHLFVLGSVVQFSVLSLSPNLSSLRAVSNLVSNC